VTDSIWPTIHAERHSLADDLAALTPEQWATQSLCSEWNVHQVLAHLLSAAKMTPAKFFARFAAARFNFDRFAANQVAVESAAGPAATLEAFRAAEPRQTAPPGPKETWLGEAFVHGEDIRRPLGITHAYPLPEVDPCSRVLRQKQHDHRWQDTRGGSDPKRHRYGTHRRLWPARRGSGHLIAPRSVRAEVGLRRIIRTRCPAAAKPLLKPAHGSAYHVRCFAPRTERRGRPDSDFANQVPTKTSSATKAGLMLVAGLHRVVLPLANSEHNIDCRWNALNSTSRLYLVDHRPSRERNDDRTHRSKASVSVRRSVIGTQPLGLRAALVQLR